MAVGPGDRIGPYSVVAAIGSGGMGEVWKARDTRLAEIERRLSDAERR
jgi:hypothetical protein